MTEPHTKISLVVAAARNGVIGEHNSLPWSLPSELKRFREITMGHPCLMGRKTWDGLKGPLKGRDNIVMSRGPAIAHAGATTVRSLEEGLQVARQRARERGVSEIMVIGGGQIYAQTLSLANRVYLTEVDMDVAGDTYFPKLDAADWRETGREAHQPGPRDSCAFVIRTLERIQK
jgi:dihydrofolate reductase